MLFHIWPQQSHRIMRGVLIAFLLTVTFLILPLPAGAMVEGIPCTSEPTDMPLSYGDLVLCQITPIGDADLFRFSSGIGEVVDILVSRRDGGNPCVELFDPTGSSITWDCKSQTAAIRPKLTKAGTYTIRVTEWGNEGTLAYRLLMQCLTGPCMLSRFPTIVITLTGCTTCHVGDTFSVQATLSNPTKLWLEIKAGVYLPDRTPVNVLGNQHIELPPGFTFNGPAFNMKITNVLTPGTYQFCGLLLERELGRALAESCQSFTSGQ